MYALYESVIFRFAYGDKINGRAKQLQFARPMADFIYYNFRDLDSTKNSLLQEYLSFINLVTGMPFSVIAENS